MSEAIAIREERHITTTTETVYEPHSITEAMQLAKVLVESRLLPRAVTTPQQAFTIMATGKELGLTAMQALRSIHVIEGKPTCSSDLILALCKRTPAVCRYFRLVRSDATIATYETLREGDPSPTAMSFTIEEAKAAQLVGKDNWKKYPAAMLRARCIAALARAVYPDLVLGVYETDEIQPRTERDVTPARSERPAPVRGVVRDDDADPPPPPIAAQIDAQEPPHDEATGEIVQPETGHGSIADHHRMLHELRAGFPDWNAKRAWRDANKPAKDAQPTERQLVLSTAFIAASPSGAKESN